MSIVRVQQHFPKGVTGMGNTEERLEIHAPEKSNEKKVLNYVFLQGSINTQISWTKVDKIQQLQTSSLDHFSTT